jgi:phenylalanyl-tRNA synthetase beta chain
MLELGQPMHGFDLAKLDGGIRVRMAENDEPLVLLDGSEVKLREDTLVIADHSKALAMAGIMGGEASGVTASTRDVLLESAFFAPLTIAGQARSYGLHTDSSHRFERGVDYALQRRAMERASALLLEIVGGQPGPITEVTADAALPDSHPVLLRRARVRRLLGIEIDDATIVDVLERLAMGVEDHAEGWLVTPPSARFDIAIEADLIEEVGRVYGYANIPANLSSAPVSFAVRAEAEFSLIDAKQLLVNRGYQEAITYSFVAPEAADVLAPNAVAIELANPISADMSVMRASLWPGLVQTLKNNLARQQSRVRVFESGLTFIRTGEDIEQHPKLAGLLYGNVATEQWAQNVRKGDFFDLKADLELVMQQVATPAEFRFVAAEHPALHPGQGARIHRGEQTIGWIGLLHPAAQKTLDVPPGVFVFEIDLLPLQIGRIPAFEPLSKFPSIRRDLALLVGQDVPYQAVRDCVREAAPAIVKDIKLFDVYTGE